MPEGLFQQAAPEYAERGLHVFPVIGKVPIKGGRGCHDATTDPATIQTWGEGEHGNANIALATGAVSGCWALDVDFEKGGEKSLERLVREHGPLPTTVKQTTGNGVHYLFRTNGKSIPNSVSHIGPGLDVRSDGGYVVIDPSIHPSGRRYCWEDGRSPLEIEFADPPGWLVERLLDVNEPADRGSNIRRQVKTISDAYVRKALENECLSIENAPDGQQEAALNKSAFSIGQLVGAGALDYQTAAQTLLDSALKIVSHDARRPWSHSVLEKKIAHGLQDGMREPRDVGAIGPVVAPGADIEGLNWPELDLSILEGGDSEPPSFPLEVFGGLAVPLADIAEAKSAPVDYVAVPFLSGVSTLIGNTRKISPWAGWHEPAPIWTASVGLPASGKSPGQDAVLTPLRELETELSVDYPEILANWETDRAAAKQRREKWEDEVKTAVDMGNLPPLLPDNAVDPDKPVRPRLMVNDATIEALARLLVAQPRGLLCARDELSGWLTNFNRYSGGGDRAFWVEAYGGRAYTVDRVKSDGEPLHIPALSIGVTGGIQPDRLNTLLMSGDDDGLASRFLLSWPRPVKPKRPTRIPDDMILLRAFRRLRSLQMATTVDGQEVSVIISLAEQAADRFDEWRLAHFEQEKSATGLYLSHLGKHPGMVLRIALALELLAWAMAPDGTPEPTEISVRSLGFAAHLIEAYFKPMAERAYGNAVLTQKDHNAVILGQHILNRRQDVLNRREIYKSWGIPGLKKVGPVTDACEELVKLGWLRPSNSRDGDTKGRTKQEYEVNPELWRVQ